MSLLEVEALTVRYADASASAVRDLSFSVDRGEALGIVGESGSGKTQTALAIMGLLPANATVSGSIRFAGQELVGATEPVLNRIRARRIAMVFQDPMAALNPYVRVGNQLRRILLAHGLCGAGEARQRTLDVLARVGLADPERQYHAYPHQLSGGMRQRAMIGAALLAKPDLIVLDEPTTALDVTVQAQILSLLRSLRSESDTALLLITHDLGVIAGHCESTLVLDAGRRVEGGPTADIFTDPESDKTRALLTVAPRIDARPMAGPSDAVGDTVLGIDDVTVSFRERRAGRRKRLQAVQSLSLSIGAGETVAIVGESGSGKTSLARAVAGLVAADRGGLQFDGKPLAALIRSRADATRRQLQMVFQDPLASLNPAMTVDEIVGEPLREHEQKRTRAERQEKLRDMLSRVGLGPELADRYPHELSGGQAQRVAIARALILKPKVLICDEAAAALDGTVQHEILRLLLDEQERSGLAIIFITHDLAVVRQIAHRVLVMYMGRAFELAGNDALFRRPRHPYSRVLIDSVPVPVPGAPLAAVQVFGEASSILAPPPGCPFHPRCPHAVAVCSREVPAIKPAGDGLVACHRAAELDLT